ncbi:MAG: divergent polysaccharide deacetylase family protein [Candidatus Omnitrophica bacterium]|nr:divergent polysaccharide deacetylase family protein [Candidatus Omnitrophota bacterium]
MKEKVYQAIIGLLFALCLVEAIIIGIQRKQIANPISAVRKPTKFDLRAKKLYKGKIAIVIDDAGYTFNNLQILEGFNYPLTFSILPEAPYSRQIAEQLHRMNFQLILHLPLEPYDEKHLEPNTITTTLDETSIRFIINSQIKNIPHIRGVSNHMGSKATEDYKTMEIVLDEIRKRKLFFIDSLVTPNSVCEQIAQKKKIPYARRDIFLDNILDSANIQKQLEILAEKAQQNGFAIGIGHDRKVTLMALKEEIPRLAKKGYRFVFVSELVH